MLIFVDDDLPALFPLSRPHFCQTRGIGMEKDPYDIVAATITVKGFFQLFFVVCEGAP